jgi:hypothetical protein
MWIKQQYLHTNNEILRKLFIIITVMLQISTWLHVHPFIEFIGKACSS